MSGSSTTLPATSETQGAGHENRVEANVTLRYAWEAGGGEGPEFNSNIIVRC